MITQHESDSGVTASPDTREVRKRRSWRRRLLYAFITLVLLGLVALLLVVGYFVVQEHRSPSGKVFVQTSQGKVELQVLQTVVAPPTAPAAGLNLDVAAPPTKLKIAGIGLDAPVFLMGSDVPKTAVVGWVYGSAMPGTAGNTVFYGARGGAAAVFEHLDQLKSGDDIVVGTGKVGYVYQVTAIGEVAANDTQPLLSTTSSVVTLITEAGQWDNATGSYTKRLIVRGTYVSAEAWEGN